MYCPDCGYEVDNTAVFCPQCRFQFQETDDVPFPDTTIPDTPVYDRGMDKSIFEERQTTFSDKEIRMLEVQLMQPAVLVVLVISLVTYTLIGTIPFIPLTIAGLTFGITGILCLACGILAGIVFFFFFRRSLTKFS